MDISVEEVLDGLLSPEAYDTPSDDVKVEDLEMSLPQWFDEKKFNQGRRFFWDFCFAFAGSTMMGFIAVLSIPSIIQVLVQTQRSNSEYTSYKRYLSTHLHMLSWYSYELKPGSKSWRSLETVRKRHLRAGTTARLKNQGTVSQRDLSLTIFGFMGFAMLKPDEFQITQLKEGDLDAFVHFWGVIGSMLGIKDRYNICRKTYEETHQICQVILDKVYTPCLTNVPEYFEHSARAMTLGASAYFSNIEANFVIYKTKHLANVPGYIYTEVDRLVLLRKLKRLQGGRSDDLGVDANELVQKCGLISKQNNSYRLFMKDFATVENSPAYKQLPLISKFHLAFIQMALAFYSTFIGRALINCYYKVLLFLAEYLPTIAMWRYGLSNAFVNIFKETPKDDTPLKLNSDFYKHKDESCYQAMPVSLSK
ncbi:uncharacterized protein LOC126974196 isoform X2 [Leptidea sinapis]|uniref:uncharacterized protein LOC126974196 isoform X2 n=1 Tax=Leptidea sinapis TaxID=189913 RepID=UPI0021C37A10|nr:uncharacterized protein LOC126974196 isoform X2 [Leptidea sinapis]